MLRKPLNLGSNKSIAEKLDVMQQKEFQEQTQSIPEVKKNVMEYKISLDNATLETLKQTHNLVENKAKASFYWKSSHHKALKKLAIDTGKPVELFLAEWAIAGLMKVYPELKEKDKK